jgi:hypothetical protein
MLPDSKSSEIKPSVIKPSVIKLRAPKIMAQVGFYLIVGLFIGWFSHLPTYQYADGEQAELKLVVRHSGNLIGECRALSQKEMEKLPPNMRTTQICPREKAPLTVTLTVNGDEFYQRTIKPSGIQSDGVIAQYEIFSIPAEMLAIRFAIDGGQVYEQSIDALPGDVLLLQYDDSGFHLRRAGDAAT